MAKLTFRLTNPVVRQNAANSVLGAPEGYVVTLQEPMRSTDQNARMWAMLADVARSKPDGRDMPPEDWKAAFMVALGHEVYWARGLDGGAFPIGVRSSKLSVREMSDLMEFIAAWGSERGVRWTDPEYAEAL